jgi:hypothetical protein
VRGPLCVRAICFVCPSVPVSLTVPLHGASRQMAITTACLHLHYNTMLFLETAIAPPLESIFCCLVPTIFYGESSILGVHCLVTLSLFPVLAFPF